MIGVEIHGQHRRAAQLCEVGHRFSGGGLPGRVQIPACPRGVVADVVAHRVSRRHPGPPLLAAVVEVHRRVDHQMATELLGQRGGHLDPQPARLIDADSLIAAGLARLTISGQKHPSRIPTLSPLLLGHAGGIEVIAVAPPSFPAHGDRWPPCSQRLLGHREPTTQHRQTPRLGEPFRAVAIPTATAPRLPAALDHRRELTRTQYTPGRQDLDRGTQIPDLGGQSAHSQLVLILHRAGDRPGPPRRRHRCEGLLPLRAPHGMGLRVQAAQPDPPRQLTSIHRTQQRTDRGQRLGLGSRGMYPGPDPHTQRSAGHHRIPDLAQRLRPSHTSILRATTDNPAPPHATLTSAQDHPLPLLNGQQLPPPHKVRLPIG